MLPLPKKIIKWHALSPTFNFQKSKTKYPNLNFKFSNYSLFNSLNAWSSFFYSIYANVRVSNVVSTNELCHAPRYTPSMLIMPI